MHQFTLIKRSLKVHCNNLDSNRMMGGNSKPRKPPGAKEVGVGSIGAGWTQR